MGLRGEEVLELVADFGSIDGVRQIFQRTMEAVVVREIERGEKKNFIVHYM